MEVLFGTSSIPLYFFTMATRYIPYTWTSGRTHLRVEVYYDLGWMSYFSGQNNPRGVYINFRSISRIARDGWHWIESYAMFGDNKDRKRLLAPLNRKSDKVLTDISSILKEDHTPDQDIIDYYEKWAGTSFGNWLDGYEKKYNTSR